MMLFLSDTKPAFNEEWTQVYSVIEAKDFISEHTGEFRSLYVENSLWVFYNGEQHECTPGINLILWLGKRLKKKKKQYPQCTFLCDEAAEAKVKQYFKEEDIQWDVKFKIVNHLINDAC